MSAPCFLDCRWERVLWFIRGLSIHPGKEPALSIGCIGGRISDVDVDVVTEREKGYVPAGVETRKHTHTACTRHCVWGASAYASTPVYRLGACKESPKLLVLSEAAFITHITFSRVQYKESRKERESKRTYEIILAVCESDLHFKFEWGDKILTKLDMSVRPLEDTRT